MGMDVGDMGKERVWTREQVVDRVNVQVNELAFVIFHDCCGVADRGRGYSVIANGLIEGCIGGKIWCVVSLSVWAACSALWTQKRRFLPLPFSLMVVSSRGNTEVHNHTLH